MLVIREQTSPILGFMEPHCRIHALRTIYPMPRLHRPEIQGAGNI